MNPDAQETKDALPLATASQGRGEGRTWKKKGGKTTARRLEGTVKPSKEPVISGEITQAPCAGGGGRSEPDENKARKHKKKKEPLLRQGVLQNPKGGRGGKGKKLPIKETARKRPKEKRARKMHTP